MPEANLRWKAQTSEAEAQILALKAVIDSIGGTTSRNRIRGVSSDLEKVGRDGEGALHKIRLALNELSRGAQALSIAVGQGLAAAFTGLASTLQGALIPAMITLAAALATIAALAAPILAAMAAVAGLGAYFDIIKKGAPLHKAFYSTLRDIFQTVGKIAAVVAKPLFKYLLEQLRELDKWVHTAEFRKGMEEIGRMLPKVAKAVIGAGKSMVEWYIRNWPTIKTILLDTLAAFGAVASAVKWLAKQFSHYFPIIRHAAEVAYQWFMQNLWPGLHRAFLGIAQIVVNLAKGFKRAWPDISKALSAAWGVIHPILDALATILGKVQDALNWLAKNSGGAFSALAKAVTAVAGIISSILSGIASAISTVVSGLQTLAGLGGIGGPYTPNPIGRGGGLGAHNTIGPSGNTGGGNGGGGVHGGRPGSSTASSLVLPGVTLTLSSTAARNLARHHAAVVARRG